MENKKDRKKFYQRLTSVIAAIFIAGAAFGCGFLVRDCTQNKYVSSYDWVIRNIKDHYIYEVNEDDVYKVGLSNLSGTVLDIYSCYYTPEQLEEVIATSQGSRTGIGISYVFLDNSLGTGAYIEGVVGNSPAYRSGLRAGTFVTGASYEDGTVSFTDVGSFTSFMSARQEGEQFTLITDRGSFTMAKEAYTSSYCSMSTATSCWDVTYVDDEMQITRTEEGMSFLPEGVAYLSLSQFYGNAAEEMAQLINRFNAEGCTSLILDLRNNGGGSVEVLQYISALFTGRRDDASKVALTAQYKGGKQENYDVIDWVSDEYILPESTDVYVLANCYTASASEALIGVLVSNGIVPYENIYLSDFSDEYLATFKTTKNCRTYGKGIMQTTYPNYFTGEAIKLTTAIIYWPNGISIHDVGLTVEDGCKTVEAVWDVTYDDEELQSVIGDIFS